MFAPSLISPSLHRREERIKTARRDTQRTMRELRRDRADLERRERELMAQLRTLVKRGEYNKANLLARQIAMYRNLSDKNFERSVSIQTEIQASLPESLIAELRD
ncbi:hypothetical protein HK105_200782 [Polyrhizophydium stewartii]|uniref:Uncharacterized protein n=1 Tax=Polyrhizophydium stewartii TaxID=2732419 RepID=A0ABR4NK04_9FUNG